MLKAKTCGHGVPFSEACPACESYAAKGARIAANQMQVGGDHYRRNEYQHWDWVTDTGLSYLHGCATKYVARWRSKNGEEDLRKAKHYIIKCQETGTLAFTFRAAGHHKKFLAQLAPADAAIIQLILNDDYDAALQAIDKLLATG